MAKQRDEHRPDPEDPKKKGKPAREPREEEDEVLSAEDAEVVEEDVAEEPPPPPGAAPKKPAVQPTKLGRAPQPTKLAKKSSTPTMLQPGDEHAAAPAKKPDAGDEHIDELEEVIDAEEPSKPPKKAASMPDLSLDEQEADAEVIEIGDEDVLATDSGAGKPAAHAEVADDDLFAEEEVFEAEAASGPGKRSPTPGVPADEDVLAAEDVLEADEPSGPGAPMSAVGADLDFLTSEDVGKQAPVEDRTELLDQLSAMSEADEPTELTTKAALERTAAFEAGTEEMPADESSAVDLGKERPASERPSGVDELAEALESGVDLGDPGKKKPTVPDSDLDITSLMEEDEKAKALKETAAESDEDILGADKGKSAAAEEEDADKTVAFDDGVISEAAEDEEPVARKGARKADREEEAEEEITESAEEEEEVVSKKKGGTAVATKPRKPKYLRRWVGGFVLALLLVSGGTAATWYFSPDSIEQALELVPPSPNDHKGVFGHVLEYRKAKKELAGETSQRAQLQKDLDETKTQLAKVSQGEKAMSKAIAANKTKAGELRDLLVAEKVAPEGTDLTDVRKFILKALAERKEAEKFRSDIAESLDKNKILEKDKVDPASFDKAMKELGESKAILGAVNKKLEDAKIKESGEKGVEELIATKKQVEDKLGAVDKALTDAMVKDPGAKGVQELIITRKKLETERNDLDLAINQAHKELASAKAAPPGEPKKVLLAAIKTLRSRAESPVVVPLSQLVSALSGLGTGTGKLVEKGFNTAALLTEVNYYRLREPFILTPVRQLDTWLALLQDRSFNNLKSLDAAMKDAAYVRSKDAKAGADVRAKALYVTALALRNQEKYADARGTLEQAAKEAANLKDAPWTNLAAQSLKELTDSSAYYLPFATGLEEQGNLKGALGALDTGLKAIPADGRLLARRSLLRLEAARSQGKLAPETQTAIRTDAEAAANAPGAAAEGFYALGQLEEALEQWTKAEDDYRKALKAHKGSSEDANRYRIALARLLLLHDAVPTVATPPAPPPPAKEEKKEKSEEKKDEKKDKKKDEKKDKKDEKKDKKDEKKDKDDTKVGQAGGDARHSPLTTHHDYQSPLTTLLGLMLTGVQPAGDDEENPDTAARLKESIDLANELIKSSNPKTRGQGYMLLGQARAKQGKRTEGLQLYVKGMDLVHPGIASKDLDKMVQEHPAFQTPDSLARPNAFLAERQFGQGLHYYWNKQYAKAEEHFNAAVGFFKQDARYYYFLGLARYHQPGQLKRDAALFAFEQGARMEADDHPSASEVNMSLERLQGNLRRFVDQFRQKALLGAQ